ncbi:transcriptional regulator [Elizabethkingia anophelis]|nr:transcriptional regulator [Elizabethkingia anophelis]
MNEEADIVIAICKYIYNEWVTSAKSQRDFAFSHGIEESTVRRIKNVALGTAKADYNMTLKTLYKICQKKKSL